MSADWRAGGADPFFVCMGLELKEIERAVDGVTRIRGDSDAYRQAEPNQNPSRKRGK
jgi:hypothetical protein